MFINKLSHLITIAFIGCFSLSAWGLTSSQTGPINLEADKVQLLRKQGIAIYKGNVSLKQGSLVIKADTIKVYTRKKQVSNIEVLGSAKKPAELSQTVDKQQTIKASSQRMTLDAASGDVRLYDNVSLNDGQNTIQSDFVLYNQKRATINAKKIKQSGRVKMILQPPKAN